MPTYVYACQNLDCNARLEVVQKMSDAPLKECPNCKGEVKKQITATAFILNCMGFHSTDYPRR